MVKPAEPELKFPLSWCYRAVTVAADDGCAARLDAVLEAHGYPGCFSLANRSANGKYVSFHATIEVPDEKTMNAIGDALSKVEGVKFLL